MDNMTIGQRMAQCIREDAKQKGIGILQELESLGIYDRAFYSWERGDINPNAYALQDAAKRGWDVHWILTGSPTATKPKLPSRGNPHAPNRD